LEGKGGTGKSPIRQPRIAAAIVMLEAAHADETCTREEMDHIGATIRTTFDMSEEGVAEIIELADKLRRDEVDLWQFTNLINENFSHSEKLQVIETVWEIIYIDGHLAAHEDIFAHQLANLLRLSHKELITAKMRVKETR